MKNAIEPIIRLPQILFSLSMHRRYFDQETDQIDQETDQIDQETDQIDRLNICLVWYLT